MRTALVASTLALAASLSLGAFAARLGATTALPPAVPTATSTDAVNAAPLRGHYKKLDESTYLLSLDAGAKVAESLAAFQRSVGFASGSLTGVGVFKNTRLGFYKFNDDGTPARTHSESLVKDAREVVSFTCNFTTTFEAAGKAPEAAPPHCHAALAGSLEKPLPAEGGFPVVGGHFIEGEVGVVAEFVVTVSQARVTKIPSAPFGGRVIDLANDPEASELR